MKFNALVVAAMVITSVNAAGEGGFWSCFGGICGSKSTAPRGAPRNRQQLGVTQRAMRNGEGQAGNVPRLELSQTPQVRGQIPSIPQIPSENDSEPAMQQNLPDDEQGSAVPKISADRGEGREMAQIPSMSRVKAAVYKLESRITSDSKGYGSKVVMPQDPSEDQLRSVGHGQEQAASEGLSGDGQGPAMPQDSQVNEQGSAMQQNLPHDDLESVVSQGSTSHEPDEPQDSVPIKKANPICSDINAELPPLWGKIYALNGELQVQFPGLYRMIMMKEGKDEKVEEGKEVEGGKKVKEVNLKDEQIRTWLKSHPKAIPGLRKIKSKYDGFEANRNDILQRYDDNKCPLAFTRFSLKEMEKQGSLPKWYDENGVNFLGEY
ncbi:hypothetical protein BASA84_000819 [Batrachochytrium salamandrivorans]|nr:hypothetical protein BASA62_000316 [Batrachochytrium salamandrivorans]KAH9247195.1 hypothetical protein BASA81_015221 [Batrachochytrium salamandrivorans]KAH9267094.1 hypothetical protein BASA84_000819 [Batrachochytrium salamandrivorans]